MTALAIGLCIACQLLLVAGQLILKHSINAAESRPIAWSRVLPRFLLGIGALSLWFFLWLGLLQQWALSNVFPFEGLDPVLVVLGARIFLKEKLTPSAWLGIVLISAGVGLISAY